MNWTGDAFERRRDDQVLGIQVQDRALGRLLHAHRLRAAVMLATAARPLVAVRFLWVAWKSGRPSAMFALP